MAVYCRCFIAAAGTKIAPLETAHAAASLQDYLFSFQVRDDQDGLVLSELRATTSVCLIRVISLRYIPSLAAPYGAAISGNSICSRTGSFFYSQKRARFPVFLPQIQKYDAREMDIQSFNSRRMPLNYECYLIGYTQVFAKNSIPSCVPPPMSCFLLYSTHPSFLAVLCRCHLCNVEVEVEVEVAGIPSTKAFRA